MGETWVASFSARYRVDSFEHKSLAREDLWSFVRARFVENGIALMPAEGEA